MQKLVDCWHLAAAPGGVERFAVAWNTSRGQTTGEEARAEDNAAASRKQASVVSCAAG
jgi:hypothetical protein